MKNRIHLFLVSLILATATILPIACVTKQEAADQVPIEQTRAHVIVREAIYLGALADLRAHPEHRPAMEQAAAGLDAMVLESRWDLQAASAAVLASGIRVASTEDAVLIMAGSAALTQLIDAITGKQIDLRQNRNAQAWITGASAGLNAALGRTVAGVAASRAMPQDTAAQFRAAAVATRGR